MNEKVMRDDLMKVAGRAEDPAKAVDTLLQMLSGDLEPVDITLEWWAPTWEESIMLAANDLLRGCGVESVKLADGRDCFYVNLGETYDTTLVGIDGVIAVSSWGAEVEASEQKRTEETGEIRCACCGAWTDAWNDDYWGDCCDDEATHYRRDRDEIVESVARALFSCAYADGIERREISGDEPGAGATPETATRAAEAVVEAVEAANNGQHIGLLADQWCHQSGRDEERFGYCLALSYLGHGVGLEDDLPADERSRITVPLDDTGTVEDDILMGLEPCACVECDRDAEVRDEQGVLICRACDEGYARIDAWRCSCDAPHHGYVEWDG